MRLVGHGLLLKATRHAASLRKDETPAQDMLMVATRHAASQRKNAAPVRDTLVEETRHAASLRENEALVQDTLVGLLGLLEEGIGCFLAGEGCGRAVAGIDHGVVGEWIDALAYRLEEPAHVAAGKVGAADTALEECVAGDQEAVGCVIKPYAARGMARKMDHLEATAAYGYNLTVLKMVGYAGVPELEGETKLPSLVEKAFAEETVVYMSHYRHAIFRGQSGVGHHMVDMEMCVDNGHYLKGILLEKTVNGVCLTAVDDTGIDDGGFMLSRIIDNVAVYLKKNKGESFYEHIIIFGLRGWELGV